MISELMSLDGRVAVVTGAAGLLGQKHCEALAEAGATVYACDLSSKAATSVANGLGPHHVGVALDVTDDESVLDLRSRLMDEHGGVDILVNNAAMNDMVEHHGPGSESSKFENYPVGLFRQVMDVNVTGVFLMSQIIGSIMADAGKGSIINIASTYGVVAPDQRLYLSPSGEQTFFKSVAYPTSKGAVIMMTKFIATYWGHRGIRANCLSPGGVENGQNEHFIKKYSDRTPLGRMAGSADYKGSLVFLASDASRYMTGQNLIVDGGWTSW
ncbi:MAG: SDR family oxidoreductase [Candidatus Kapabacteria bacterium]|nr:SDR family oxidoreductase [Candidatus Kapabacteria bacterium]